MKYILFFIGTWLIFSCSRTPGHFLNSQLSSHSVQNSGQQKHDLLLATSDPVVSARFMTAPNFSENALEQKNQSDEKKESNNESFIPEKTHKVLDSGERHRTIISGQLGAQMQIFKNPHVLKNQVSLTNQRSNSINSKGGAENSASDWEPRLKIGLILLGIGIVLSIFGLGWIAGIAAFIGLIFTIIGLLHTY